MLAGPSLPGRALHMQTARAVACASPRRQSLGRCREGALRVTETSDI